MRLTLSMAAVVLGLLAAGCGGDDEASPTTTGGTTETETTTEPGETTALRVYFLRQDRGAKVWPVRRDVGEGEAVARAALEELLAGPTEQEATDLGLSSAIPDGVELEDVVIEDGVARVELSAELEHEPLAQVVYTVGQFPAVDSVEILPERDDRSAYTRADFEDVTPAILVESPLAFEEAGNPLRVTGTANTFEANFEYELTDTDGRIVDDHFVTATSGSGTRGTFDFTTKRYSVPFEGVGSLIVFESSAKDGSRINLVEIPLRMTP